MGLAVWKSISRGRWRGELVSPADLCA